MIPGPVAIASAVCNPDDSESIIYTTLLFGFDTEEQALRACHGAAQRFDVPLDDLVVLRTTFFRDVADEYPPVAKVETSSPKTSKRPSSETKSPPKKTAKTPAKKKK